MELRRELWLRVRTQCSVEVTNVVGVLLDKCSFNQRDIRTVLQEMSLAIYTKIIL